MMNISWAFLFLVAILIGLVATVFWVWMLIDCLTKEPSEGNDKLVWALVILFAPAVGALIYFCVRRPNRLETYGQ